MIGKIIFIGLFILKMNFVFAQNIYIYPEKGFKRVDLNLPPIENDKEYKVEIKFGTEVELSQCSTVKNIYIDFKNLKLKKGFGYHYYVLDIQGAIFQKDKLPQDKMKFQSEQLIKKKLLSFSESFIDYKYNLNVPFFIPENLTLEYRLWKDDNDYKSLK